MSNSKKKLRIDHVSNFMSKRHGILTEKFTIFSTNAGKSRDVR